MKVSPSRLVIAMSMVSLILSACAVPMARREASTSVPAQRPRQSQSIAPEPTVEADAGVPIAVAPAEAPAEPGKSTAGQRVAPEPTSVEQESATPPADNTFQDYGVNPYVDARRDHLSTFGLDVDTASYGIARRYVMDGNLPPFDSVRVEEFVNSFDQDYALPRDAAFAVYADGAPSPFHSDGSYLLRVGVQGYEVPEAERKPAMLTFIIDVSGSMAQGDRLEIVKQALGTLVENLRADDSVSIVAFTTDAWVVLNPTSGRDKGAILDAIDTLYPQNTTNVGAGLGLGYDLALETYQPGATNRVILCSDGVANTGAVEADTLVEFVRGYSDRIMLTSIGVGMGNYNDVLLENLADKGNGFYAYVDTLEEAQKLFIERLTGTLQTIAKDAKVQVDFNPDVVSQYRLIGYENRAIADRDFRNDRVDAGEIGAGHTATALYQVLLKRGGEGRIATVQLRWKDPDTDQATEINGNVNTYDMAPEFEDAAPRYQLAATVAQYAEILRQSPYADEMSLRELRSYADRVAERLSADPDVQEFADLVLRASRLAR